MTQIRGKITTRASTGDLLTPSIMCYWVTPLRSKEGKKIVVAKDSHFSGEVVKHHNMIARITPVENSPYRFEVHLYDVQTHESYRYDIPAMEHPWSMMRAADGGLVCFVSVRVDCPVLVAVINPITMATRTLPLPHTTVKSKMAHLTVEPETGEYNLVLVSEDGRQAEPYNPRTGQWTNYEIFETHA